MLASDPTQKTREERNKEKRRGEESGKAADNINSSTSTRLKMVICSFRITSCCLQKRRDKKTRREEKREETKRKYKNLGGTTKCGTPFFCHTTIV